MITVREALLSVNRKELIDTFIYKRLSTYGSAISLLEVPKETTFDGYLEKLETNAKTTISNLIHSRLTSSDDNILFACHRYSTEGDDIVFELISKKELLSPDWKQNLAGYCYMAEPFEEIASYRIADTYLTKRNLTDLLVDVIYEASWFGPNQEKREEFIESLNEDPGEARPIEELFEKFEEEYGWTPEKRDLDEELEERNVNIRVGEYNRNCFLREAKKIRDALTTPDTPEAELLPDFEM